MLYKKQFWIYFVVILTLISTITFAWYKSSHPGVINKPVTKTVEHTNVITVADTSAKAKTGSAWEGTWERPGQFDAGVLSVDKVNGNVFEFSLNAVNGSHSILIEEKATLSGNTATYLSPDGDGCKITFKLSGDSVVDVFPNKLCEGGNAVYLEGKYYNKKNLPKPKAETMVAQYLLTADEDAVFRKLADTSYHTFVDCSQMIAQGDEETKDRDGLNVRVISAHVRGMYGQMQQITMIDKDKHIWAAVIDYNKVRYFTNVKEYADKLPKTIENWRENFKEYPVVYMSKK